MSHDLPLGNDTPVELSAASDFTLGALSVRPSVRAATRSGQRHHVEPRVMQVLVALVRANGAVVSRSELMRSCWNARIVGEAAIHRCISKLRDLADAGDGRTDFLIETIPRVGYRLAATSPIEHPISRTIDAAPARTNWLRVRAASVAACCVALAAIALAAWYTRADAPARTAPSIAVMPFADLGTDAGAAPLAASLQNEVLTRLAGVGALRVISRTSSDRMAERAGSITDIARKLGVANVIEGTVQRSGNTVRVTAQLIRVAGGDHVWAEGYERTLDDNLSAENAIADAIVHGVVTKLAPGEVESPAKRPPPDRRAHELYLRGLVLFRHDTTDDFKSAARVLREAVAIDPSFAAAWALLSRVDAKAYFGGSGDDTQRSEARDALEKAKALAPSSIDARLAEGFYEYHVERDFRGAARVIEAIRATWPNNVEVLQTFGFFARRLGHWQKSIDALREVVRLDPLVPDNYALLAETLAFDRDTAGAIEVLDAGLALWPDNTDLRTHKICALQASGQLERARVEIAALHPPKLDPLMLCVYRMQYAQTRRFAEGLRFFESVRALPEVASWDAVQTALLDTILGDFRRRTGDDPGARAEYEAALQTLRDPSTTDPNDPELLSMLSIAYSGLGDKASALRYANRASEWYPFDEDPVGGADFERYRATALARLGDADAAIPSLARLLESPGNLTIENLRLDPDFDRLRDDPRFSELVASRDVVVN